MPTMCLRIRMNELMLRRMTRKMKKNKMLKMMFGGDRGAACDKGVGTIVAAGVAVVVKVVVGVDILGVCNVAAAYHFALRCNFCRNNCLLVGLEFQ